MLGDRLGPVHKGYNEGPVSYLKGKTGGLVILTRKKGDRGTSWLSTVTINADTLVQSFTRQRQVLPIIQR